MTDKNQRNNAQRRALMAARRQQGLDNFNGATRYSNFSDHPHQQPRYTPPTRKKSWLKRILLFLLLIILISGGVFGYKIIAASEKITVTDKSILGQLKDLLLSQGNMLGGEADGRINILLIAIGGEGHKGRDLADTIMLASIRPAENKAAILSIPRDLYVQVPEKEYYSKINAVHAYGESQKKDQGPEVLRELVQDITGEPIHYYVRIDFTAFKSIIDSIGGVNITIDSTFFDYWHKIEFPAGTEKMKGERALAYARARYIEGPEGGDFKRAARQQQILLALREKVFSVQTAFDFGKMNAILESLSENIRTDMELWEMRRFYELARTLEPDNVKSTVLTSGPKGILVGETQILGGVPASVLKPRTGDFSEVQSVARNIFELDSNNPITTAEATAPAPEASPSVTSTEETTSETSASEASAEDKAEPADLDATIEIRNTTNIAGLAGRTRDELQEEGFTIEEVSNATIRNLEQTTVYFAGEGKSTAEAVAKLLDASVESGFPDQEAEPTADLLILLGQNEEE